MIYPASSVVWKLTRPFGRVGFSVRDGNVFIHAEISNWNKATVLECASLWGQFLRDIVEAGQSRIFSVIPADDEKMNKFSRQFGFRLLKTYNNPSDGKDYNIYTQEIA